MKVRSYSGFIFWLWLFKVIQKLLNQIHDLLLPIVLPYINIKPIALIFSYQQIPLINNELHQRKTSRLLNLLPFLQALLASHPPSQASYSQLLSQKTTLLHKSSPSVKLEPPTPAQTTQPLFSVISLPENFRQPTTRTPLLRS